MEYLECNFLKKMKLKIWKIMQLALNLKILMLMTLLQINYNIIIILMKIKKIDLIKILLIIIPLILSLLLYIIEILYLNFNFRDFIARTYLLLLSLVAVIAIFLKKILLFIPYLKFGYKLGIYFIIISVFYFHETLFNY